MTLRETLESLAFAVERPSGGSLVSLRNRIWSALSPGYAAVGERGGPARLGSDEELYRGLVARDAEAFDEVAKRHLGFLMGVARGSLSQPDAEDAVQATFVVLIRKAERWDGRGELKALLFGLLRLEVKKVEAANLRAARAPELAREQLDEQLEREGWRGYGDELARALLSCSELEREVILLWIEDGLDAGSIGERLELGASHVRTVKHRAIQKLRRHFGERAS